VDECAQGRFERMLPDALGRPPEKVKKILLCSGKIYYELAEYREANNREDVAIIRIEQLYPMRTEHLASALAPYRDGTPAAWVQEEPANMGAWFYMRMQFCEGLLARFPFSGITRPVSASPAGGSPKRHKQEQNDIITRAFAEP
jgi:2-oxoglutarate dehydrogenase E1 component